MQGEGIVSWHTFVLFTNALTSSSHSLESVVSLPLQAVQVALLVLALSSVAMFVFWWQLSSAGVWLAYTAGKGREGGERQSSC